MKKSQLKTLIKEIIKETPKKQICLEERINVAKKAISDAENFGCNVMGFPKRSQKEIRFQRKKLYEEIMKESKHKTFIDSKKLLKEVKYIQKLLSNEIV